MPPFVLLPIGFGFITLLFVAFAVDALRKRRLGSGAAHLLAGIAFGALALAGALVTVGTAGYHALTRETVAATVAVERVDQGSYLVRVDLPEDRTERFTIRGDEVFVDAHILKWHPIANVVGLHTGYTLDRIGGRYREVDAELAETRTLYSLSSDRPVDLFAVANRFPFLQGLVDATYGSGTFAPLREGARYEVRVSTTGLLVRPVDER